MEKKEKHELGITVSKEENFSEWFSQVVFKANLADIRYGLQGFIVHREWGMRILRKIYELLEEEVEKQGHEPVLFPVAIPQKFFEKEKEHVEGFAPEVFWITKAGDNELEEPFALRPTSETAFYSMYALWIRSWKDLPFKRYQSRICVYRYESHTRPFLRGREFLFFETHCAFRTHEDAMEQIKKDMETMKKVAQEKLFIPFVLLKRPEWDKFAGAHATYAADCIMPDGKVSQIGTTHDLAQKFSKAFNVTFKDKDMKDKYVWITCFGPGIWRLMAAVIAIHGDDQGLILPSVLAPYQAVIIPIYFKGKEEKVENACKEVENILTKAGFSVIFDNNKDETPGFKFNKWELLGVPLRIEIGPKDIESKSAVIVRRVDREKIKVSLENIVEELKKQLKINDEKIKENAKKYWKVHRAKSFEELQELIKKGGFIKAPFCDIDKNGEKCAEELQRKTALKVRGIPVENQEKPEEGEKCIVCGKPAKYIVWLAKAY
ncbi:MAG TPA: proline--tRNA ligase [Nanoarchaeota archaeon]|nr:proline--tRNA ligase [Nanoarchaeota archaeon]